MLKNAFKEQEGRACPEEEKGESEGDECLETLLASRIFELLQREVGKIFERHEEMRGQLRKMVEGQVELQRLLLFYDWQFLKSMSEKAVRLRKEGSGDADIRLVEMKGISFPQNLGKESEPIQAGVVLLGFEEEVSLQRIADLVVKGTYEGEGYHHHLNHVTLALECRDKLEGLRDCAATLKSNCLRRIDAIQRELNGY
ncbi:unnamed protein product [Sphagnum balticum]